VHARYQWPANQVREASAESVGTIGVGVLASVRKLKSQHNLSLKKPVLWCKLAPGPTGAGIDGGVVDAMAMDLKYAIGTSDLSWADDLSTEKTITTEDGSLCVAVAFAN
jgi:hypothetical protein